MSINLYILKMHIYLLAMVPCSLHSYTRQEWPGRIAWGLMQIPMMHYPVMYGSVFSGGRCRTSFAKKLHIVVRSPIGYTISYFSKYQNSKLPATRREWGGEAHRVGSTYGLSILVPLICLQFGAQSVYS